MRIKKKVSSIKLNAVLNILQTILSMLFPIITFPYASRVLGVEEIGKYNFAQSIISYFILIAGMGISTYAVREGARIRENKEKFEKFASDVFSINIYSTFLSYLFLIIIIVFVSRLKSYWGLLLVLSSQVLFITLGRSWLYNIFEDYLAITIRSIVFQVISIILLFVLVRSKEDVIKYAFVSVFSVIGQNIVNFMSNRKYCKLNFYLKPDKKHLIPILLIFSTSVSIVIYGSSDMTMLGFLTSDYYTGLYGVSVKIYNIVKQIVASTLIVTIPRFSYYLGGKQEGRYNSLIEKVFNLLLLILLPTSIGLLMMSKEIIIFISGSSYVNASLSLSLLAIAMIFNLIAYMLGYCVLIPHREDKLFFRATFISALVNVILNFFVIPLYKQNGAAFTTIVAEGIAMLICYFGGRTYIPTIKCKENVYSISLGCVAIILICRYVKQMNLTNTQCLFVSTLMSCTIYVVIQFMLKNTVMTNEIGKIIKKIRLSKKYR